MGVWFYRHGLRVEVIPKQTESQARGLAAWKHPKCNGCKEREMNMSDNQDLIRVNANVSITVETLQAIVANAKKKAGKDERGIYRVDTADAVSDMITKFLLEKDFEGYVMEE